VIIDNSILSDNLSTGANPMGGAICNGFIYFSGGTVTVENSSNISGITVDDVQNSGTFTCKVAAQSEFSMGTPPFRFNGIGKMWSSKRRLAPAGSNSRTISAELSATLLSRELALTNQQARR